jgi:hypothetical protein
MRKKVVQRIRLAGLSVVAAVSSCGPLANRLIQAGQAVGDDEDGIFTLRRKMDSDRDRAP